MLTLYTIVYVFLLPFLVLRLFWRARKAPAYSRRIRERFALIPSRKEGNPLIWVHAVSVGEVIAATPIVKALMQAHPDHAICITTTTPTGSDRVRAAFGDKVLHYYMPYDFPVFIIHFIRMIKPKLLLIMETELWPNLIAVCHRRNIPVVLANGRMSKSSAKGYRKLAWLTQPMLESMSLITAQSRMDAERFIYLGAKRENVKMTGSVKFDVVLDEAVKARAQQLGQQLQCDGRKVVVFAHLYPEFLAIVVPRHPERFNVVADIADQLHIPYIRLSSGVACGPDIAMVLGDTMGDMLAIYGLADVAFVGGSLIPHGGHNVLEAAAWSVPILSGASVRNFMDIAKLLVKEGGMKLLHDHLDLERSIQLWLAGLNPLEESGVAANRVLLANRGALQKLLENIEQFL